MREYENVILREWICTYTLEHIGHAISSNERNSNVLASAIQNCVDQILENVDGDEVCLYLFENEVLTSDDFENVEARSSLRDKVS